MEDPGPARSGGRGEATTALLVVATNRYVQFVEPLVASVRRHFHPTARTAVVVFTDSPQVPDGVLRVETAHLPGATLRRYHMVAGQDALLRQFDYLYCCDADMRFAADVGPEILGDRVGTLHPGFFRVPRRTFPYETRPASTACIGPDEGHWYFAGGFNGGRAATFLDAARTIQALVDRDQARGLTAVWHDESYLNRTFCDRPPTLVLSPSYCYPESAQLPLPRKLLALDKPHAELRQ
jgi:histo-blood group ABO system transferase